MHTTINLFPLLITSFLLHRSGYSIMSWGNQVPTFWRTTMPSYWHILKRVKSTGGKASPCFTPYPLGNSSSQTSIPLIKAPWSFEMLETNYPVQWCNVISLKNWVLNHTAMKTWILVVLTWLITWFESIVTFMAQLLKHENS
jgi:hypothetical protein